MPIQISLVTLDPLWFILDMRGYDADLQAIINGFNTFFETPDALDGVTNHDLAKQLHGQGSSVGRISEPGRADALRMRLTAMPLVPCRWTAS